MRRATLGLMAAAVIAGGVGVSGAARATPNYVSLGATGNTLQDSSGNTWYVGSCSFGGNNGCANFAMYNDGTGIGLSGNPGTGTGTLGANGLPTLGSEIQTINGTTFQDVTVDLFEYTGSTFFAGSATLGSAHLTSNGPTRGGTATVTRYDSGGHALSPTYTIGLAGSGNYASSVSFTPVNTVEYNMDVPLTTALVTVTYGTPVPEPASLGIFGLALLAVAAVRYRRSAVSV